MTRKHLLLCGVSALSIGLLAGAANAQEMETVVVTGIRASLQSAQAIKQNSTQVVDSITAVDIGALPDRNVAEALQRVPGVTLQRNDAPNDLTRMGSTGNSVFVRGLSWVQSTMNGRDEFSANDGRTLNFADVPADLILGVDVFKSPTASMIEGGIGGVIDLRTRKPFDQDGQKIAVSGDYTYGDLLDAALPSVNGLYSNRWTTSLGEIGALFTIDWQDQANRTSGINLNTFDCWNSAGSRYDANSGDTYTSCMAGTHVNAPNGWAWRQMEWKQQRLATNLVVQWRPSDTLEFTVSGFNTYANIRDSEHYVALDITDYNKYIHTGSYNGTSWTGSNSSYNSADMRAGGGRNRTSDINFNAKWNPNDKWEVSADVQFVESDHAYRNNTSYTNLMGSTFEMGISVAGNKPKITWSDASNEMGTASNYYWGADMEHFDYNVAHAWSSKLDASYKFSDAGILKSIDFGVRDEQKVNVARTTGYDWQPTCSRNFTWVNSGNSSCPDLAGNLGGAAYTARDGSTVTAGSAAVKTLTGYAQYYSFQSLLGNKLPNLWVPSEALSRMSSGKLQAMWNSVSPAGSGFTSYYTGGNCKGPDVTCLSMYANTSVGASAGDNRITPQKQSTNAAYVQANFSGDTMFGFAVPFDGNLGVRAVKTQNFVGEGKLVLPNINGSLVGPCTVGAPVSSGSTITAASCTDFNKAFAFWGGTYNADGSIKNAGQMITRPAMKTQYTNILPSFNMTAHLSDEVQARLGYSESMLRPDFYWTRNSASLSFNWADAATDQAYSFKSTPSGSGGNPNLRPMHSTNYDFSLEWYFTNVSNVTVSVFQKKLTNYIYTASVTENITNPYNTNTSTNTLPFYYTTYVNGSKGGVDGFEFSYTQFYDFLPGAWNGLGFQANYTRIYNWGGHNGAVDVSSASAISHSNDASLPMEGMSKDSFNLALLYSKYDIDFRMAYDWRSEYLSATSGANINQPVWMEAYGQLDSSIFYSFLDHYKVGFQVYNITGENFYSDAGSKDYHPRTNYIQSDRKFSILLRATW